MLCYFREETKMCTGKDRMHVLYLFVLLSPKMIWWHLRCSKEYYTIYVYVYIFIPLKLWAKPCNKTYFSSKRENQMLSSFAYYQWPQNQKVVQRHLSLASTHAGLSLQGPNLQTPDVKNVTHMGSLGKVRGRNRVCRTGVLSALLSWQCVLGGKEAGGQWTSNQKT